MFAVRHRTIHSAILTLALGWAITGCSSDEDPTGPGAINPAVLGNWDATSFNAGTGDLIGQGMTFSFFFGSDGGYSFTVTGDLAGICDTGTNCSDFGDFTASATQIVATIVFDNATPADPAVVGTWNATSLDAGGTELIALGMSFSFTFGSDGTYIITITNDQGGLCDVGTDCTPTGSYTASATQIVLDPGTVDESILNYSISGTTMTVNATVDGTPLTVILTKV